MFSEINKKTLKTKVSTDYYFFKQNKNKINQLIFFNLEKDNIIIKCIIN